MGSILETCRRWHVRRCLRIGAFVALSTLAVAAPALAAVTSTTSYSGFAPNGDPGDNHWSNVDQSVPFIVVPTAGSTAMMNFSSDNGGSYAWQIAAVPGNALFGFVVATEGAHAVKFYAADTAQATEDVHSPGFINIDKTNPAFTALYGLKPTFTKSAEAGWSSVTSGTVNLMAADSVPPSGAAISGVRQVSRSINGGPAQVMEAAAFTFSWTKGSEGVVEGSNAVVCSVQDWAGNALTTTGYINIDTASPTTTAEPPLAPAPRSSWRPTPVVVSLDAVDAASGVPADGSIYVVDNGTPRPYRQPFTVGTETTNGSIAVQYSSTDRAGNEESPVTGWVNIDTSIPTVSATSRPSHQSGWYNEDVVVTLAGADAVSGVAKTQYRRRADAEQPWTDAVADKFTVSAGGGGAETYDFRAVDRAGNVSAVGSTKFRIDTTPPSTHGKGQTRTTLGKKVAVWYRILDDLSPEAQEITVIIRNNRGEPVWSYSPGGTKKTKAWHFFYWKPWHRSSYYRYKVYAKDLAGNAQTMPAGGGRIIVK
jgi:hypothetical protein